MLPAMVRPRAGKISIGISHSVLTMMPWRSGKNPVAPLASRRTWVTPEKYQKNRKAQPRPRQSMRPAVREATRVLSNCGGVLVRQ